VSVLATAFRGGRIEVVEARSRMRIQDSERCRFVLERADHERQHAVLEHGGMVAGMVFVLVAQQEPSSLA
jgi:hypothetical protein